MIEYNICSSIDCSAYMLLEEIRAVKSFFFIFCIVGLYCLSANANSSKVLNVFTWSEYIPHEVLAKFTEETGIKVNLSTFESNEGMYAKLKLLGGQGYDIVMPSNYFIERLQQANLLEQIDKSKIIGLENLDPESLGHPFDPNNEYSIPYMWGSLGILINKKAVDPNTITSFNDLTRPEFNGRILLSDDMRDTFGVALKASGYSINTTKPEEIKAGYEWLKKLKPSVRVFDITATKQAFIGEEVLAGISWNGDAFIAMQENPNLEFIVPKEGLILWIDNFSILANAPNKDNAYAFINFLLRPDIAKQCVEEFFYTTPNKAARELFEPFYRDSKVIFPTDEEIRKGEITSDIGKAFSDYIFYWEKLKFNQ